MSHAHRSLQDLGGISRHLKQMRELYGRLRAAGKPADVLTPALLADVFGVRARTAPSLILELP